MKRKLSLFLALSMSLSMSLSMTNSVSAKEFTDTKGNWAEGVIDQWSNYNVLGGYADGSFNPAGYITRAEVSAVIDKVMHYKVVGNNTFNDLKGNEWYANSMLKNVAAENIKGYNGGVHGMDNITRQEVAAIICSAFDIAPVSGSTTFADDASIADWAKGSVKALQSAGYVNGRQGNKFAPKENITRAEVVAILDNIVEELYTSTGTYSGNIEGNVVVNTEDVVLKDATIKGDLFIAAGVGEGDLTLDNVNVTGNVIVEGGGSHSVKFTNGSKAKEVKMQKNDNNTVRLFIDEKSSVAGVSSSSNAPILLEGKGNFGTVTLTGTNNVTIAENTTIQQLVVKGGGNITNNGTVAQMIIDALAGNTVIKGAGQITALTVNNKSVEVDTKVLTMVVTNENAAVKVSDKVEKVQDSKGNDVKDKVTGTGSNNSGTNSNGNNSNNNSGNNNGGGSTDGGNTDGGNTDGGNTDGGNTDGGNTDGGNTDGGNTDGGNTDGGNTDDGNTDGGNTDGGNTDGGNTDGGNTDGGDNTDKTAPKLIDKSYQVVDITTSSAIVLFEAVEVGTYTYSVNDTASNVDKSYTSGDNFELTGLEPGKKYIVELTLKDKAGNVATYTTIFTTEKETETEEPVEEVIKGMNIKFDFTADSGITLTSAGAFGLTSGSAIDVTSGSAIKFFPVDGTEDDEYTYYFELTAATEDDIVDYGEVFGYTSSGVIIPTVNLEVGEAYNLKLYLVHNNDKKDLGTVTVTISEKTNA